MILDILIPKPESRIGDYLIARGSGIVGSPVGGGRLFVDYEGNLYNAINLRTYPELVKHAAGRHVTRYPTNARACLLQDDLVVVGSIDTSDWAVTIRPEHQETVRGWLA